MRSKPHSHLPKPNSEMKPLQTLALMTALSIDTINFDDLETGAPPPRWTTSKTGKGEPKWEVVADDSAPSKPNVLKQSGEATYPVCIKDDTGLKDGFVEVKFKPISGKEDQAGGVIWRCQDADNYYIARANALENQRHHLPHRKRQALREETRQYQSRFQQVAHFARGF